MGRRSLVIRTRILRHSPCWGVRAGCRQGGQWRHQRCSYWWRPSDITSWCRLEWRMAHKTWLRIMLSLLNFISIYGIQARRCTDENIRNIVKICDPHLADICGSILGTMDNNFTDVCRWVMTLIVFTNVVYNDKEVIVHTLPAIVRIGLTNSFLFLLFENCLINC